QDPARAEQRRARMQERMAKRLGELKAQLRITPAQEGAWTAPAARRVRCSFFIAGVLRLTRATGAARCMAVCAPHAKRHWR
ncbi:MAG: hypothetical protein EOO30_17085, partial [Comamonadaceae bacterium]